MTSNEAVGPMDIKNLLDLLNASEEGAAPGNDRETVLPLNAPEPGVEKIEQQEVLSAADLRRTSSMACRSARPNNCAQSQ